MDGDVGLPTNVALLARTDAFPVGFRLVGPGGMDTPVAPICEGGENGSPSFCVGRPSELAPMTTYTWTLVTLVGGEDVTVSFTTGTQPDTTAPLVTTTRVVNVSTETVDNANCGRWDISTWRIQIGDASEPGFLLLRAPEWSAPVPVAIATGNTETNVTLRGYPNCLGLQLLDRAGNELPIAPLQGACLDAHEPGESGCALTRPLPGRRSGAALAVLGVALALPLRIRRRSRPT